MAHAMAALCTARTLAQAGCKSSININNAAAMAEHLEVTAGLAVKQCTDCEASFQTVQLTL